MQGKVAVTQSPQSPFQAPLGVLIFVVRKTNKISPAPYGATSSEGIVPGCNQSGEREGWHSTEKSEKPNVTV
jgi:hypothetical protein